MKVIRNSRFCRLGLITLGFSLLLLTIETASLLASSLIDRYTIENIYTPYRWNFTNSLKRVGFMYQPQWGRRLWERNNVLGLKHSPNSLVAHFETLDGNPFGQLQTDPLGFVKNLSGSEVAPYLETEPTYLILFTGGSNVMGIGVRANEETLPSQLESWLQRHAIAPDGKKIRVLNAAVNGHNAAQELIQYALDFSALRPNLWLQMNGGNEAWKIGKTRGTIELDYDKLYLGAVGRDTMVRFNYFPATQKFFLYWLPRLISPPRFDAANRRAYGELKTSERFIQTIRSSAFLAKKNGTSHLFFLQPTLAGGKRKLSAEEASYLAKIYREESWQRFQAWGGQFFDESRGLLSREKEILWADFSRVLDEEARPVYFDPQHFNHLGNSILAEKIGQEILRRGILKRN